ncbi:MULTISPECIES: AlbA family DNA-binding domain-containing protein [Bacillus subtilis group]|uniref:AlbA family DNA-binding domain-containing protein n=1 Tax=Bacillus subtilis group TaxID=653685 RepID=UPI000CDAC458|nr:ATP-binding protein [Bacillus stercoris]MCM2584211.1 ATP-binding protein [Bacillus stercoris]POO80456.1 ATP-binding protein [Bacillus sp. MBGLi97]
MTVYKLNEEIKYLISLKKEGDYWDYKQEWHDDNERLIHDILCFVNTVHSKDCFLIIGVSDNGEIIGLNSSQRKKQADIIDILRSCKFAGDNVPIVKLEKVTIEDKHLDVLIILNSEQVPFYLAETNKKHKKLIAGYIYSRIEDTNTPISKNTSVTYIEALWKKRFGIHLTGLERFSVLLNNPKDWVETEEGFYNIYNPDFLLENGDYYSGSPAFYSYCMDNEHTSYESIVLKYNGTILKRYETAILDSGRYRIATPDWDFISCGIGSLSYKYYVVNNLKYKLNKIFFDEQSQEEHIAQRNFNEVILIFNSDIEKEAFKEYVIKSINIFEKEFHKNRDRYFQTDNEKFIRLIITGLVLNEMLKTFRGI